MAFRHIGKKATIAIRQAAMGPTFGIKGGAAGGGYSQAVPFELLNLHLTGDMHAVTAAHNQIAAMVDNSLYRGNEFGLDLNQITWKRVIDVNDRALRNIVIGLGAAGDGVPRQAGFDITAASEVMAVLALSKSLKDLSERLGRIVVGYTKQGEPVTAEQLRAAGAAAVIMREALKPNLLQTLENTPVFVHAGPFGNIAHGNSSVVADLIGIHTGDFLVTEAGFGADMGAERFFNIKCRVSGLKPDAAVVVATVRALKSHSGKYRVVAGPPAARGDAQGEPRGRRHRRGEPAQAAGEHPRARRRAGRRDQRDAVRLRLRARRDRRARRVDGRSGPRSAPTSPTAAAARPRSPRRSPRSRASRTTSTSSTRPRRRCREKIEAVATKVYGADGVDYTPLASRQLDGYERNGFGSLPVCIAKTQYSLSHDASLKGAPTGFRLPVREVRASVGAGFIYPICGDMRTMPGLAGKPAAISIDLDDDGNIVGLY